MITDGTILYICDRKRCINCNEDCKHTTDVKHAINPIFEKSRFRKNENGDWWEIDDEGKGLCKDSKRIRG